MLRLRRAWWRLFTPLEVSETLVAIQDVGLSETDTENSLFGGVQLESIREAASRAVKLRPDLAVEQIRLEHSTPRKLAVRIMLNVALERAYAEGAPLYPGAPSMKGMGLRTVCRWLIDEAVASGDMAAEDADYHRSRVNSRVQGDA